MKSIIIIAIVLFGCIAFNEALECYSHELCSANCPQLVNSVKKCGSDENKCYKAAVPGGVSRGCAKDRCNVQVNLNSVMASVCCESNLCNSAITSKITISTIFMIIGAFFLVRL